MIIIFYSYFVEDVPNKENYDSQQGGVFAIIYSALIPSYEQWYWPIR